MGNDRWFFVPFRGTQIFEQTHLIYQCDINVSNLLRPYGQPYSQSSIHPSIHACMHACMHPINDIPSNHLAVYIWIWIDIYLDVYYHGYKTSLIYDKSQLSLTVYHSKTVPLPFHGAVHFFVAPLGTTIPGWFHGNWWCQCGIQPAEMGISIYPTW